MSIHSKKKKKEKEKKSIQLYLIQRRKKKIIGSFIHSYISWESSAEEEKSKNNWKILKAIFWKIGIYSMQGLAATTPYKKKKHKKIKAYRKSLYKKPAVNRLSH